MKDEIAIVTGSSSGFGLLISLELAKRGYRVIATMRNSDRAFDLMAKASELGIGKNIEIYQLDVVSKESLGKFKVFLSSLGRVDALVNNAGYAGAGFVEEIPIEEYKMQFDTNVFGMIEVTQSVLPYMRKQRKGKVINISSISGRIGFPGLSPYVASKHAVEGWSECLRQEVKAFGIDVALVEPGSYRTNIWSSGKQVTEKSLQIDSPYYEYMKKIEAHLQKNESQYGDPQDVAKKVADIAQQKGVPLRHPIGKGVRVGIFFKNILPWNMWERLVEKGMKSNS
ncbi:SDR family oxidoreductase [Peribacillus saganii]|uniref:SDR family oxidoreductase n=1 Tax=Peribacillus saganii TaxID=2303992 RepID=A0A372LEX5_9BACI|nr:oxidoreductase [Peribacillus saganii]RFU64503.1 SDR family oxidoreductase [Peribacillus saganii]